MLNRKVKDSRAITAYAIAPMETMGERIRTLREARNLTQPDLGKLVGVTKGAVSQWENGGTANIKLATFMKLCEVLLTDPQYLIWGYGRSPGPEGNTSSSPAASSGSARSRKAGDSSR